MKKLYESILDNEKELMDKTGKASIKKLVTNFIVSHYWVEWSYGISVNFKPEGCIVDINGDIQLTSNKLKELTNGMFEFGEVTGTFNCRGQEKLESLKGGPRKVSGDFDLFECKGLKSLEGAPKEIGGVLDCTFCDSLKDLKGCPERIGKEFECSNCKNLTSLKGLENLNEFSRHELTFASCPKLKSLKGAPERAEYFIISDCESLTSLKDCPKYVGVFNCSGCPKIKDLKGAPKEVSRQFICKRTNISKEELENYSIKGEKRI